MHLMPVKIVLKMNLFSVGVENG